MADQYEAGENEAGEQLRFRASLLDALGEALVATDLEGRITFWNPAAERMYGWSAGEVLDRGILDLAGGGEPWVEQVLQCARSGQRCTAELVVRRRDGAARPALLTASPVADDAGQPVGVVALTSDVTQQRWAEAAVRAHEERELRQSQRQLNAAQRLSSTGSWDTNLTTNASRWSEELFRILGVGPEVEPSCDAFIEAVHPDDREYANELWKRVVETGREEGEFRIVRADGGIRILHALVEVASDEPEAPVHLTGTVQDVTERRRLERELERQAFHDGLTGLPNRVLLSDRVDHALKRRQRTSESCALLFIDLDDFKTVNDSLGHNAGDELLAAVGRRLRGIVRPSDTVARLGGDEFAVLLEGAGEQTAELAAARLLAELGRPVLAHGHQVVVHACVGIAVANDQTATEDLLRNADTAMYEAKSSGKHQYRLFRASMHTAARRRLELEVELERAVDQKEFLVYYQPIVQLDTGRVSGLEALVRWAHPEMGIVPPAEFMPVAEESGLIVPIGTGVLREATAWLQQLNGAGGEAPLTMSVNLSPRQFLEPNLLDSIEKALRDSALDPRRLVVEITEKVLVEDTDIVAPLLSELRTRGVHVAVDDFGTGFSSLSYLRRLPIDVLKIDRAFVSGLTEAVEDAVVAEAVVRLADALGFATSAEGIETPEQARELRALGSTFGQGYLYSPPLASGEARDVLQAKERVSARR